jgi:hypothetical protein
LIVVLVVRVRGRGLGVRLADTGDSSSVILYPGQVRWLCGRRLLAESVCREALQALRSASDI